MSTFESNIVSMVHTLHSSTILSLLLHLCLVKWSVSKSVDTSIIPDPEAFLSFDILHVNDIHAHFDEVNANNGRCRSELEACYGGFPRLSKAINDFRQENPKSLLLNAGDYFQGTIWYTHFKYEAVLTFSNMLNYNAMSLGNHEFDDDLDGIKPFVAGANFPVLACNIKKNDTGEPVFEASVIDESLGTKIGIIGYVSTSTPIITNENVGKALKFTDEVECIREEARRLQSQGVNIIIALGHSGYEVDLKIAREVKEVDIVVGGHSHTFLYPSGETPPLEEDNVEGDYPTYVTQKDSTRVVPVVQAFCFSKYLGQFRVNFNEEGELLEPVDGKGVSLGRVHLLDEGKDNKVIEAINVLKPKLKKYYRVVGEAKVDLRGSFMSESSLGNVVADSMMLASGRAEAIAFVNNGGLRSDIGKGDITFEDIVTTLPFNNNIEILTIKGKDIRRVLENVASKWGNNTYTTFLQVSSAARLEFLIKDDNVGSRLTSFKVKCEESSWCDLEDEKEYEVVLPSFIANGGFEGPNFADVEISRDTLDITDGKALMDYVSNNSPVYMSVEDRIKISNAAQGLFHGSHVLGSLLLLRYVFSFFFSNV